MAMVRAVLYEYSCDKLYGNSSTVSARNMHGYCSSVPYSCTGTSMGALAWCPNARVPARCSKPSAKHCLPDSFPGLPPTTTASARTYLALDDRNV